MIFIGGISTGRKVLDYVKTVICGQCGSYGRYQVYMTYQYFSFFFIPLFKWGKRFFVVMSCCESTYELDPEVGKRLLNGEHVDITEKDLTLLQSGRGPGYGRKKTCPGCGYETTENFDFCPQCGQRLE
ncbi:MAG: zinc ribbon domain-containing protein [Lachnospiraceae bacterium]